MESALFFSILGVQTYLPLNGRSRASFGSPNGLGKLRHQSPAVTYIHRAAHLGMVTAIRPLNFAYPYRS
jgi:hypothetical protein